MGWIRYLYWYSMMWNRDRCGAGRGRLSDRERYVKTSHLKWIGLMHALMLDPYTGEMKSKSTLIFLSLIKSKKPRRLYNDIYKKKITLHLILATNNNLRPLK